jgi:hypothetical protein
MGRSNASQAAPLLGGSTPPTSSLYTDSSRRPARDVSWAVTYALCLLLAIAGGVYAGVHR